MGGAFFITTMSWAALTEANILDRLASDELSAYQSAGEETSRDRLPGIIVQVTGLVRGKVASYGDNVPGMGPAGTIPSEALWAAATIARNSLVASLPVNIGESDPRRQEGRDANDILASISKGELSIEPHEGTYSDAEDGGTYGGEDLIEF